MISKSSVPHRLPYDILWEVFHHLWHSDLAPQERITAMTSSLLVSKMWTKIFVHIAYKHAHIPCASYLDAYLRIMGQGSLSHREFKALPQTICRSITVDVVPATRFPSSNVVAELLYKMRIMGTHRNLYMLILRYSSAFPSEVFNTFQFVDMPSQVTHLELHMPSVRLDSAIRRHPSWYLPELRHLSVLNANGHENLIPSYVASCPQLSTLESDCKIEDLKHTVEIADPDIYVSCELFNL